MIAIDSDTEKSERLFTSTLERIKNQNGDIASLVIVMVTPPPHDAPPGKESHFFTHSQFQYLYLLNQYVSLTWIETHTLRFTFFLIVSLLTCLFYLFF